MTIVVTMRTSRGQNAREHWRARARRVKAERSMVAWALAGKTPPALPVAVVLTRVAPSQGLDDDNLSGALKAVRDEISAWLGVDDRDERVRFVYGQRRGPWTVEIDCRRLRTLIDPALPAGTAYLVTSAT